MCQAPSTHGLQQQTPGVWPLASVSTLDRPLHSLQSPASPPRHGGGPASINWESSFRYIYYKNILINVNRYLLQIDNCVDISTQKQRDKIYSLLKLLNLKMVKLTSFS